MARRVKGEADTDVGTSPSQIKLVFGNQEEPHSRWVQNWHPIKWPCRTFPHTRRRFMFSQKNHSAKRPITPQSSTSLTWERLHEQRHPEFPSIQNTVTRKTDEQQQSYTSKWLGSWNVSLTGATSESHSRLQNKSQQVPEPASTSQRTWMDLSSGET